MDEERALFFREEELVGQSVAAAGIPFKNLDQLWSNRPELRRAAPVLVAMLDRVRSATMRLTLLRMLPEDVVDADVFVQQIKRVTPLVAAGDPDALEFAWTAGASIFKLTKKHKSASVFEAIRQLVQTPELGDARQMLVRALGHFPKQRAEAIPLLVGCVADRGVAAHAVHALGLLGAAEALPLLNECLSAASPVVRTEAAKAIRAIRGSGGKAAIGLVRKPSRRRRGLATTSINLDIADLGNVLSIVSDIASAPDPSFWTAIVDEAHALSVDEERDFHVDASWRGHPVPVVVTVFISDEDAVDLQIASVQQAIDEIDAAFGNWMDS